jgi:ubiquinone/menaquinone biosynthesis C-methylase UbiE
VSHEVAEHFAQRACSYEKRGLWVADPLVMSVTLDFLGLAGDEIVLDAGAGTGTVLHSALHSCPTLRLPVAVDCSGEMLVQIKDVRIPRVVADGTRLPFAAQTFDVVLCRQVLHYLESPVCLLQEAFRVLRPGGRVVIGQITPFSEVDEDYWRRIILARQPLRKYALTLHDCLDFTAAANFRIVKVTQIRAKESLNSWLSRYSSGLENEIHVRRLHADAPEDYKIIHRFSPMGDDLIFDNCWTFIRAQKRGSDGN